MAAGYQRQMKYNVSLHVVTFIDYCRPTARWLVRFQLTSFGEIMVKALIRNNLFSIASSKITMILDALSWNHGTKTAGAFDCELHVCWNLYVSGRGKPIYEWWLRNSQAAGPARATCQYVKDLSLTCLQWQFLIRCGKCVHDGFSKRANVGKRKEASIIRVGTPW